ncbi:uncharacterized protein BDR25DRAFT_306954 [Lindgomyces ingoldianus]|uniref:Uncharacterized protein n=1 Tax=Lindgomyces ingoldianus TaxID=673940 RepID=A0ACB6QD14_9PLEO|nr:uncharacterized protein BDR25DRAFT_306954 [Lindgomyces ingoldianus]KAF2464869.1 hypothetical protein BDR25DRAFT_306954 [Lindgomyces ingoldianus]
MRTNFFAVTAGLASTASAFDCTGPYFSFYNRGGNAMSYQRLDPALFPGIESPHLHSFDGGNGLAATMGFDTTQESSCTTARIKPDKSLYWRPTLYWNGNNTGFYRVPDKFLKIYYKFGDAGNIRANVTEFPEGFRMIAGNSMLRHDDGVVGTNKGPGIQWSCKGENYASTDAIGFPKGFTSCKEGLASQITFPACWNGKDLDPKDPTAHMAWPTAGGTGLDACPDTHKTARFPSIFIEFWYDVSAFDGQYSADSSPWVLANGDPTGYGFHADFLNGWEKGVLNKAIAPEGYCNCGCGCGNDQMKACFGANNVNDDNDAEFKSCSAKATFGGDDSSPLEQLPGCNPLQSGPADATSASGAGCSAAPAASEKASSAPASVTGSLRSGSASLAASMSAAQTIEATSAEVVDFTSHAVPTSLSLSLPGKAQGTDGYGYGDVTPTSLATVATTAPDVSETGTLGPFFSDMATNSPSGLSPLSSDLSHAIPSLASTASPAESSGAGGDGACKPPVYITITPTVYVTAADAFPNITACDDNTVYTTITNTATVTVPSGGYKHKRHADLHKL